MGTGTADEGGCADQSAGRPGPTVRVQALLSGFPETGPRDSLRPWEGGARPARPTGTGDSGADPQSAGFLLLATPQAECLRADGAHNAEGRGGEAGAMEPVQEPRFSSPAPRGLWDPSPPSGVGPGRWEHGVSATGPQGRPEATLLNGRFCRQAPNTSTKEPASQAYTPQAAWGCPCFWKHLGS